MFRPAYCVWGRHTHIARGPSTDPISDMFLGTSLHLCFFIHFCKDHREVVCKNVQHVPLAKSGPSLMSSRSNTGGTVLGGSTLLSPPWCDLKCDSNPGAPENTMDVPPQAVSYSTQSKNDPIWPTFNLVVQLFNHQLGGAVLIFHCCWWKQIT